MTLGRHFGDLGHLLGVLDTIGAGHGMPEGAKWGSLCGRSTVLLETRVPDWRAMGSKILPKDMGKSSSL